MKLIRVENREELLEVSKKMKLTVKNAVAMEDLEWKINFLNKDHRKIVSIAIY